MLNDAEFAALTHIPTESVAAITENLVPFTLFGLRSKVLRADGATETVELWSVQKASVAKVRNLDAVDDRRRKAENLARYIEQGYAFEKPGEENVTEN